MTRQKYNPLRLIWDIFSIISGLFGLSSMVDGLINWRASIQKLISEYQSTVYPVFEYSFGWLPFSVPTWINDYIFIGILIGSSMTQAQRAIQPNFRKLNFFENILFRIVSMPMFMFIWPLWILKIVQIFFFKHPKKEEMRQTATHAFYWLGALTLCFLFLLIFNYKMNL